MNIIISREEQTFGPYSSEEVERFLDSGELSPSDLASWEGSEDWVSLGKLLSAADDTKEEEGFDEEDDDFDHEKMKQWEDVFVDDEEEDGTRPAFDGVVGGRWFPALTLKSGTIRVNFGERDLDHPEALEGYSPVALAAALHEPPLD